MRARWPKFGLVAALAGALSLLHHGHIAMFLAAVQDSVARLLRQRYRRYRSRMQPSLFQVYFGRPEVHYEVWVQRKTRSLEIGLHFEGERERNYRLAEALSRRATEIRAKLGADAEIEEWTRRWTRLHESWPVAGDDWRPKESLTPDLARKVARRLARYIEVLEPMLAREEKGPRR